MRVIERAARNASLREAVLDGLLTFEDAIVIAGPRGLSADEDIDRLVEDIKRRKGQGDPGLSEDQLAALVDTIKNGLAGKVLEPETARAALTRLAAAGSPWEVELRAVNDGDAPRVVVMAGDDVLSALGDEASG